MMNNNYLQMITTEEQDTSLGDAVAIAIAMNEVKNERK